MPAKKSPVISVEVVNITVVYFPESTSVSILSKLVAVTLSTAPGAPPSEFHIFTTIALVGAPAFAAWLVPEEPRGKAGFAGDGDIAAPPHEANLAEAPAGVAHGRFGIGVRLRAVAAGAEHMAVKGHNVVPAICGIL